MFSFSRVQKIMQLACFLVGLVALYSTARAQLATYDLNIDASANSNGVYDGTVLGGAEFVSDAGRDFLRFPENDGALELPISLSNRLDDASSFEIRMDFKLPIPVSGELRSLLQMRTPCQEWVARCPGLGVFFWGTPDETTQQILVNFADGREDDFPDHPANQFEDNIKWLGTVTLNEWHQVRLLVDFEVGAWILKVDDVEYSGTIENPEKDYQYDRVAIQNHIASNPVLVGNDEPNILSNGKQEMFVDQLEFYSPASHPLAAPDITYPGFGDTVVYDGSGISFSWSSLSDVSSYVFQLDDNPDFASVIENVLVTDTTFTTIANLSTATYYWRVRGLRNMNEGPWESSEVNIFSTAEISTAFNELQDHISGVSPVSTGRVEELSTFLTDNVPVPIDEVRSAVMEFIEVFETHREPLFSSPNRVARSSLPAEDQLMIFLQDLILQTDFVADRLPLVGGLAYEAATVFPGSVSELEPRISSAQVTWDATYRLNPAITLTSSEFVVRPSGYWAPAGEVVTIRFDLSAVDKGISVLVGAHFRLVTDDLVTQNRFQDIGTEFPVDRTEVLVANPFGGGIYLKVPDGVDLGMIHVEIHGAVRSAYFSYRTGHRTDVGDWNLMVTTTSVPWVDLESDQFMFTMPLEMAREIRNPDQIMERWEAIMSEHQALAGRTDPTGRAEYYLLDRQLVTPAFGAGYPVTISPLDMARSTSPGDFTHDEQSGTWNPFRIVEHRPHFILLHEMGHNVLLPHLFYDNGIDFNSESVIHIFGSRIYNTLYHLSEDEAFRVSAFQNLTMDESALDWILTHNFRNDLPIGHDPTISPDISDQIRYQHRGHAVFVQLGHLFGWDALGQVFGRFYQTGQPQDGMRPDFPFVYTRERLVEEASEALQVDLGPYFHFWGIHVSPQLRQDLRNRFPQSTKVLEQLKYYLSIVPSNSTDFDSWYDRLYPKVGDVQQPRWDDYRSSYDESFASAVRSRISAIITEIKSISGIPSASFVASVTEGAAPLTVSFDATGSTDPNGDPLSFEWDFGDGNAGNGAQVEHTYTAPGQYTVTLTVSDGAFTDQKDLSVTVSSGTPSASFVASVIEGAAPLTVSFDAIGSTDPNGDPLSFEWDFGDGNAGNGAQVEHTYIAPGQYTVILTVSDGTFSDQSDLLVTVSTNVAIEPDELPVRLELGPAYPNPFNPTVNMNMSLPTASGILLEVFDATGRIVDTLLNTTMSPGYHTFSWSPRNASSGVYFIRLSAGNEVQTRRVVLAK